MGYTYIAPAKPPLPPPTAHPPCPLLRPIARPPPLPSVPQAQVKVEIGYIFKGLLVKAQKMPKSDGSHFPFVAVGAQLVGPRFKVRQLKNGVRNHEFREMGWIMPSSYNFVAGACKSLAEVCLSYTFTILPYAPTTRTHYAHPLRAPTTHTHYAHPLRAPTTRTRTRTHYAHAHAHTHGPCMYVS